MNIIKNYWHYFFAGIIILLVFKTWFLPGIISGGDFIYAYTSMFENRALFPLAWDWSGNYGLGSFAPPLQWVNTVYALPVLFFGAFLQFPWSVVERVSFFFPYLVLGLFSSWYLAKTVFGKSKIAVFTALLYITNTYALMMSGGGQIVGVGLAYAVVPLAFARFILLQRTLSEEKNNLRNALLFSLSFSLLTLFDIRFAYLLFVAIIGYALFHFRKNFSLYRFLYLFVIPFSLTMLLHVFWLLPILITHQGPNESLNAAYNSTTSVSFFSFAKFENTLSLLHPNWPENIFGKVSFMKPEFLILPILAFLSLCFVTKKKTEESLFVLYFSLLGLIGAFLAKGSTDPFGSVYLWLFNHFPGFSMFRDPTKWYTLVAVSYSLLVPFAVAKIYTWIKEKQKFSRFNFHYLFLILVFGYLLFLIKPALSGELNGTLTHHTVTSDYQQLAKTLESSPSFYRTLWFPTTERYGYATAIHPTVSAQDFFKIYDQKKLLTDFEQNKTKQQLENIGVRYIIVPDDVDHEIFLEDRKYSERIYQNTYVSLQKIKWLHEIPGFGRIKVFALNNAKDHFWIIDPQTAISSKMLSPVHYQVILTSAKKNDILVFAESYDTHWIMSENQSRIHSQKYQQNINSFALPKDGNYTLDVRYQPQQWIIPSVVISFVTLITALIGLLYLKRK